MKFEYYPDTDTLYIQLQEGPGVDAHEVAPDTVLDYNENGDVIGIEIEHASKRIDLMNLQLSSLPLQAGKQPVTSP